MTDTTPYRATAEALEAGSTCPHIRSSDEGTSYCGLAEQQAAATPPEPAGFGRRHVPLASMTARASIVSPDARRISNVCWSRPLVRTLSKSLRPIDTTRAS